METALYDSGVHAVKPGLAGDLPGCITCHQSHGPGLPPAAGAVNRLCASCHAGAMDDVQRGGHVMIGGQLDGDGLLNCASCHEVHATRRPHMDARLTQAYNEYHQREFEQFEGSVHADLIAGGDMTCISCHSTHKDEAAIGVFDGGCGSCHCSCHEDVERVYRSSAHRFGRLRGSEGAATCADCHRGHAIRSVDDLVPRSTRTTSPVCAGAVTART